MTQLTVTTPPSAKTKDVLSTEHFEEIRAILDDGGEVLLNPTSVTIFRLEGMGADAYDRAVKLVKALRALRLTAAFVPKATAVFESKVGMMNIALSADTTSKANLIKVTKSLKSLATVIPLALDSKSITQIILPKGTKLPADTRKTLGKSVGLDINIEGQ